jgi:hypothetical protein
MTEERSEDWVVGRPQPALRPFVERYCGYRMTGFPAGLHRGVPSRHLTFIVSIGNDIDVVRQTNPADAPGRYRCAVGGLQASSALIAHDGNQEGVAVELTPLGSRALFGLPAAELWDRSLELADVIGPDGGELWERLQSTDRWEERFAVCDGVLARRLRPDRTPAELRFCWETLVASGGQIRTSSVPRTWSSTGWSKRVTWLWPPGPAPRPRRTESGSTSPSATSSSFPGNSSRDESLTSSR